ncbi:MAG TPA: hypothetical protein VE650_12980, partial [Acetobacteraceae bacterium]|nr:hypothetical protein [Acetobacteraceae bacterium]
MRPNATARAWWRCISITDQALLPFTPDPAGLRLIEADPAIEEYRDALYVPFRDWAIDSDPDWGLYDSEGQLIRTAAYCRGPERRLVGQSERLTLSRSAFERGPDTPLIYAGPLIFHYGHFLLTTLCRLWPFVDADPKLRFLWISPATLELLAHTPHIGACLAGFGLDPAQFRRFERPTRIPRLTVVAPAFEEEHFAHRAYRRLCLRIGASLAPEPQVGPGPPAYL